MYWVPQLMGPYLHCFAEGEREIYIYIVKPTNFYSRWAPQSDTGWLSGSVKAFIIWVSFFF